MPFSLFGIIFSIFLSFSRLGTPKISLGTHEPLFLIFSIVFRLGTHLCFPPGYLRAFYLYFSFSIAPEKYVPTFFPGDQIGYSGRKLPNARRQVRGVFTASVCDRYSQNFFFLSGSFGPFSYYSSFLRFYVGWNQPPRTSRCSMLMQDDHLPSTSW